jgi:phosphatidylglycerol:prolipoprotein diacylglycerol transferase
MIPFPNIDPVAVHLGPLAIRWYSLAYISGILLGWWIFADELKKHPIANLTRKALDDMILWAVLGIVLGGRLGYVLFYKPGYYFEHPGQIPRMWEGGMSFHGGMLGFILAFYLFSRKYHVRFAPVIDRLCCVVPIGLGLGRLANFINGELYGRPSDVPWAMVFPRGGDLPRHPSQLYEAGMEGVILFALLMFLLKYTRAQEKPLFLGGVFLTGYSCSRIIAECFREPDDFLGYLYAGATMGQLLSLPMLALGIYLMLRRVARVPLASF